MKRNILPTLTPVLYTLLLLTLVSGSVNSQNEFITTWKTNNTGGPNDSTIYLPILAWPTTSYNVDWDNDGVADTLNLSGPVTLHFDSAGEYTIRITGTYPGFATGGAGSNELISIDQWGNNAWDTLSFQNSSNLIITSVDTPNLTALTHLDHLFDGASSLNSSVAHWDVSNITSMHAMFANTDSFDQSLATWNIESATDITDLFLNAGISTSNYDATLLSWSQQDVQPGLTFGGGSSRFCDAVEERRILMDSAGWTFTDGGYDFTCKPDENFVTQWKTNNSGATGNTSIRLPIYTDGGYYFVDWGDGSHSEYLTGNKTHTYSSAGTYTVTIWGSFPSLLFYSSSDSRKLLKISQWGTNAWNALRFQRCENLVIDAPDTPDLALVNDMSNMFREARNFNSPIGHWDVSNVTNMASMFEEAEKFNQPLESWDVGNVTNMESMFAYAYDFNKPLNNWDVSRVKDMAYMFVEAEEFNQPLNNWDVDSVTNMRYMLLATKFNHPIGNWNVSSVTDMAGMFSITPYNHPLNDWDVSNVTDMSLMFESCDFNHPLDQWDVSNVKDMERMFAYGADFDQSLAAWQLDSVSDVSEMFNYSGMSTANYDSTLISWSQQDVPSGLNFHGGNSQFCEAVEARKILMDSAGWTFIDGGFDFTCKPGENFITQWKTNNSGATGSTSIRLPIYTDGGYYFVDWGDGSHSDYLTGNKTHTYSSAGTYTVTIWGSFPSLLFYSSGDSRKLLKISQWGTNAWTGLRFQRCQNLVIDAPDTPDLALVTDMSNMFREATNFNSPIGHWDVSTVTDMQSMFEEAEKFNQPLDSWDVGNVTNMESMFAYAYDFNKPLNNWDVSRVKDMAYMFVEAEEFNQPLNNWDVDSVTNMRYMLLATKFNHPIGNWNVSSVTDMVGMFSITPYNHPLNDWDVSNVTNMSLMFEACDFDHPLDQWDVSNVKNMKRMFAYGADFDQSLASWQVDSVSNFSEMFNYSGMSTVNYDSTLISWSQQNVLSGLSFHGGNSKFCAALDARKFLQDSLGWNISDAGYDFSCNEDIYFRTRWKTDNAGITGPQSLQLPIYGSDLHYYVDWGDGKTNEYTSANPSHDYSSAGFYVVKVVGDFSEFHTTGRRQRKARHRAAVGAHSLGFSMLPGKHVSEHFSDRHSGPVEYHKYEQHV